MHTDHSRQSHYSSDDPQSRFPLWLWIFGRVAIGLRGPRRKIWGHEFAGVVEAVGKELRLFARGDRVFGDAGHRNGACAEYVSIPEKGVIALKPAGLTYEEAAAVPSGALTALHFLRKAKVQRFLRELIEAGGLKPVINACYSLDEIVDAHRYVDQGHKKGNVVITIERKRP
jgi:NADPH:quinone reductase-like Zn-dependent oxidoreductase